MLLLSLLMAGCKEDEKVVELTPVSVSSVETEAATTQKSTKSPTEPTTVTEEEVKISPRVQRKLKKIYLEGDCIHTYSGAIFVEE